MGTEGAESPQLGADPGSATGPGGQNAGIRASQNSTVVGAGVPHPALLFTSEAALSRLLNPSGPWSPYPGTITEPFHRVAVSVT